MISAVIVEWKRSDDHWNSAMRNSAKAEKTGKAHSDCQALSTENVCKPYFGAVSEADFTLWWPHPQRKLTTAEKRPRNVAFSLPLTAEDTPRIDLVLHPFTDKFIDLCLGQVLQPYLRKKTVRYELVNTLGHICTHHAGECNVIPHSSLLSRYIIDAGQKCGSTMEQWWILFIGGAAVVTRHTRRYANTHHAKCR